MDKEMEQFQADLLQSVREMRAGQEARVTHVSKQGLGEAIQQQTATVAARSNDAAMVELLRKDPDFADEYLDVVLEK